MKNRVAKTIIVHSLTLAVMIIFSRAEAFGLKPFGYSAHLAILLSGGLPLASLYFVLAEFLAGFSMYSLASSAILAVVGVATNLVIRFVKGITRKKFWRYVFNFILQSLILFFSLWFSGEPRIVCILSVFIGGLAASLLVYAAAVFASGNYVQPSVTESAGIGLFGVIAFIGLSTVSVNGFPIYLVMFSLAVLFMGKCRGSAITLCGGLLFGLGCSVGLNESGIFSLCATAGLAGSGFSSGKRFLSATALPFGWLMASSLFAIRVDTIAFDLIALSVGGLLFVCCPKRAVKIVCDYFRPSDKLTLIAAVAGMGRKLPERLLETGEAFGEMSEVLTGEDYSAATPQKVERLTAALLSICTGCRSRRDCDMTSRMDELAEDYLLGGELLRSAVLSTPCSAGGQVLKRANEVSLAIKQANNDADAESKSQANYAKRLQSLRELLNKLARKVTEDYRYDVKSSEELRTALPECGVACGGALVTSKKNGIALVSSEVNQSTAEKAMSKAIGRVKIDRLEDVSPGWVAVGFSPAPTFDVVYAISQKCKTGNTRCGDSYSANLYGTKAMLSLCDGCGTGATASKLSQATLSLIESHYRAGFCPEDTVSSVNAFLASKAGDDFSALDILSIDLIDGNADLIKAGSPATFILSGEALIRIEGSALPVGALDTASYALSKKRLYSGDIVIMVTDGVMDSLPSLPEIISAKSTINVKRIADEIIESAIKAGGANRDDMSCLVVRLIKKRD